MKIVNTFQVEMYSACHYTTERNVVLLSTTVNLYKNQTFPAIIYNILFLRKEN